MKIHRERRTETDFANSWQRASNIAFVASQEFSLVSNDRSPSVANRVSEDGGTS